MEFADNDIKKNLIANAVPKSRKESMKYAEN